MTIVIGLTKIQNVQSGFCHELTYETFLQFSLFWNLNAATINAVSLLVFSVTKPIKFIYSIQRVLKIVNALY
jgi:hypothetical protein